MPRSLPYFNYDCDHALCNSHHIRELERAWEQDEQQWAKDMQNLLVEINNTVNQNDDNKLSKEDSKLFRNKYRMIIQKAKSTDRMSTTG